MRKHPAILTKNVPKGKAEGMLSCINFEARYLETLPRNPPVPMSNSVLIIEELAFSLTTMPSRLMPVGRELKVPHKGTQSFNHQDNLMIKLKTGNEIIINS